MLFRFTIEVSFFSTRVLGYKLHNTWIKHKRGDTCELANSATAVVVVTVILSQWSVRAPFVHGLAVGAARHLLKLSG